MSQAFAFWHPALAMGPPIDEVKQILDRYKDKLRFRMVL